MIGIIGAMQAEVEALQALLEHKEETRISGISFQSGTLAGQELVIAACGIGKVHAALCAQTMILQYRPSAIINCGVAGCLAKGIAIGDIVVARDAVQHDMDTVSLGDAPGMISGLNLISLPCAQSVQALLLDSVKAAGVTGHLGTVASGDQFIHDGAKKQWIHSTFAALCCEMEGAAIAQVCYINATPCGILRAISDNADGDAPVSFLEFLGPAVEKTVLVMQHFVKNFIS